MKHLDEGTLQAWLDMPRSGLDASEVAEIESHLAMCGQCSAELEALRGSDERVHGLLAGGVDRTVEPPPFEEVVARAERGAAGGEAGHRLSRLNRMAWAASIVVAIGVGWMTNELYRGGPPSLTSTVPLAPEAEIASDAREADVEAGAQAEASAEARAVGAGPATEPTVQGGRVEELERLADPAPPVQSTVAADDARAPAADQVATADGAGAGVPAPGAPGPDALRAAPENRQRALGDASLDAVTAAPADDAAPARAELEERIAPDSAPGGATVVQGVVRTTGGAPVQSAQVYVDGLSVGSLTREDGSYTLVLPEGMPDSSRLDLVVERIGFRQETRELSLGGREAVVADFDLQEEALQLQEVVVTGDVGQADRRTVQAMAFSASVWRADSLTALESVFGRPPLLVSGLDVLSVQSADGSEPGGSRLVRIRQDLGDGVVLTLVEGIAGEGQEAWPMASEGVIESRRVGDVLVTGTAPVSTDSLGALLDRLD